MPEAMWASPGFSNEFLTSEATAFLQYLASIKEPVCDMKALQH
jgi:hypothetical protein